MNYLKYNRSFVMMEEQNRDFAAKEAPIKGYLKVETGNYKGALRCVVQNLKYHSRGDYIYKLILFGKKQGKTLHSVLGSLIINRYGNGETYFRFDPLNLDGKGNRYDDFTVAIVAAASNFDETEPLHPVLKGLNHAAQEDSPSFELDQLNTFDEPQEEKPEPKEAEEGVVLVQGESLAQSERAVFNSYYNEHLLQFCDYVCTTETNFDDVLPFDLDRTGAKWKKVPGTETLPLVSPGAHYFAKLYKHFLFGAKPDADGVAVEFFFAVPGRFAKEEQPDGGRSGFTYWQPVVGAPHEQSAYGYWILSVNAENGNIQEVRPVSNLDRGD